jgi:hypothetical protein
VTELDTYFPSLPLMLVTEPVWDEERQSWGTPSLAQMAERVRRLTLEQVAHWLRYRAIPENRHECAAVLKGWLDRADTDAPLPDPAPEAA